MSQVVRGRFDTGDAELQAIADELTERLGDNGYQAAYRRGADMPRPEALSRPTAESSRPPQS